MSNNSTDDVIRHLFAPGLLGPMPGLERDAWPALPRLENLLARADRRGEPAGYAEGLFALFGFEVREDADLPTAAVSFLGEVGAPFAGTLVHADPLQLLPDRDRLLAFGLDQDPLSSDEVVGVSEVFNAHFDGDDVQLVAGPNGHLYLRCGRPTSIRTHPLPAVIGRNLDHFLPDGDDRRWWRGLLNETQMLFHGMELNREREAQGRPLLGGLWFSGVGVLPPAGQGPIGSLVGDCTLARGLQALCTTTSEDELVVVHTAWRAILRGDGAAWLRGLASIEARLPELQMGCAALQLHPGNGTVYEWRPRAAWRLWRRQRPLQQYLDVVESKSGEMNGQGV